MLKSIRVIGHLIRKEFIQVFRDHQMRAMMFAMPIVMVLLLGYAVTVDVKDLSLGVIDHDHSPESRQLVEKFRHNETFALDRIMSGPAEVRDALDRGEVSAALVIPAGFARSLGRNEPVAVQLLLDGVDSNASLIASNHVRGIVESYSLEVVRKSLAGADLPDLQPRVQVLYNPELISRFYMVPGVVVILLTMLSTLLTGLGLVREKETGTLEQLSVTPVRTVELILGKLLPFVLIAFFVLSIALAVCLVWFGVPMRGSWGLLVLFSLLFLLNTLGVGLLVSTIARTQQQALFMVWFILIFGIVMSGFFFPIENMPPLMQRLTYLNPLRYFLVVVRELFLKGSGIMSFRLETMGLLILGPVAMTLAAIRFRKRAR
ncbi:ABC transporter permease [Gemmatimonadota bacterium]